jgi:hypothetical protein
MMRPRWSHLALQLAFLPLITSPLATQGASSAPPDSATALGDSAAVADPAPRLGGLKVSGYVEASYTYSSRPVGRTVVGRLYDRFSDQFTLNALKVALDRPFATDKWDAGVHADVLIGQNAPVLQSSGFSLGPSGDVTQLYVTLNLPTPNGNGLQFKAGKFVTLMGVELIEDVANPNWSEGLQFIYVENFTSTGIEAGYKLSPYADVQLRLSNGWDRAAGNGGHKDFMGRVGVYPGATTSIGLVGYYGAQQVDNDAKRHGSNVIINQKIGALSMWLQGDYGKEQANAFLPDSTRDAEWWALGTWLSYDVTPKLGVAVRADYLDDQQGFRTSAAFGLPPGAVRHKLWSATGTLNMRTWPSVVVRPEVRYDHSNQAPFDGKRSQVTVALSVAYLY